MIFMREDMVFLVDAAVAADSERVRFR